MLLSCPDRQNQKKLKKKRTLIKINKKNSDMAIIYSYPLAEEVTNDSWVLGSEMDNGLRVVKNYSVGDIVSFTRGFVTLNDVLDNDNESLLDAKIGDLYLYDDFNEGYGKIRLSNDAFRFTNFTSATMFYVDSYSLSVGGKMIIDGQNLTQPRQFTMPNKSGVVALTSDLITGYVPYTGATGNVNLGERDIFTAGNARLGDDGTVWGTSFQFQNTGSLQSAAQNNITWVLPDESGTVALTLDLPQVAANFANDAAAAIGGIAVGGLYHTAGTVKIRLV
jgi:hypothetical protein